MLEYFPEPEKREQVTECDLCQQPLFHGDTIYYITKERDMQMEKTEVMAYIRGMSKAFECMGRNDFSNALYSVEVQVGNMFFMEEKRKMVLAECAFGKIRAIKKHRELFGSGLKEAKDQVEQWADEAGVSFGDWGG